MGGPWRAVRRVYFSATGTATNSVLPSRIRRSARVSPALAAATCSRNCSALVERFDELVPVLMHGDTEICHYHLDAARLDAVLAEIG